MDGSLMRDVVMAVCNLDPGVLSPGDRLADIGVEGLDLLACLAEFEHRFGIVFPAELVYAIDSVGDVIYYTEVKQSQI